MQQIPVVSSRACWKGVAFVKFQIHFLGIISRQGRRNGEVVCEGTPYINTYTMFLSKLRLYGTDMKDGAIFPDASPASKEERLCL